MDGCSVVAAGVVAAVGVVGVVEVVGIAPEVGLVEGVSVEHERDPRELYIKCRGLTFCRI